IVKALPGDPHFLHEGFERGVFVAQTPKKTHGLGQSTLGIEFFGASHMWTPQSTTGRLDVDDSRPYSLEIPGAPETGRQRSKKIQRNKFWKQRSGGTKMKGILKLESLVVFFGVLVAAPLAVMAQAKPAPNTIVSRFADAAGVKFHYLTAGEGPVVILLHG